VLLRAAAVTGGAAERLSDEEIARRERQRISSLSGIVDYHFSPDGGTILFPLSGDLYLYEAASTVSLPSARLTATSDNPLIASGAAEFIAQEEMDRDTGYWWSPDGKRIAFLETDETPVGIERRFEVYADSVRIVEQRYPATGTANVTYRLGVVAVDGGETRWLDLGDDRDIYIARVDWFPDSRHLAVQRQDRPQQTLELLRYDITAGDPAVLLTETSDTWIDIFDDLTFLPERRQFVWSSARDGGKHFYLYGYDGTLVRQLTRGDWEVTGERNKRALLHVDEASGDFWFMATRQSPTERHLYRSNLGSAKVRDPERISERQGWHGIAVAPDGSAYVDTFSNTSTPPNVTVRDMNGAPLGTIEANALTQGHPYYPYAGAHAKKEFGTLKADDGQTLHYYLRRPPTPADEPAPAIVIVYGGPHGQRVTNAWGGLFEQVLTQAGYVVFSLDNRGTDFRGTAFDNPIYEKLGTVEIDDQRRGVEYLASLPFVDGGRIGVFGWSYGGYMALHCLLQAPDLFAAGVSGAPVTDWTLYDTHYTERYLSTPADNPSGYEAASVFPFVAALDAPLLLIHGMADDNVLFTHSTKLMAALQAEGKLFELMTYPGSKHGLLRGHDEGRHAYRTMLDFFDRYLK
ncbi:MAG: alpha/beta fold hydrolase, partial [Pseudomonadota bacterium]